MTTASPSFKFSGVSTALAKKTVAATTSFTATLDDISGIKSVEWSVIATDESTLPGDYTLVQSGIKGSICTLTSLGLGTAAILQCKVNGGVDPQTEQDSPAMTATAMFEVLLANGGSVGVVGETTQRSGVFGSLVFLNDLARRINGAVAAGVTTVGATLPITSTGGLTPTLAINAATNSLPGSMSAAHHTLLAGATSSSTASSLVRRDASANISASIITADGLTVGGSSSTFSSDIANTPYVDTYAGTMTLHGKDGGQHNVTLTGDVTFAVPTDYGPGSTLYVFIRQGGSGAYLASWTTGAGGFYFPAGVTAALAATAVGDADVYTFKHSTLPSSHWVCLSHLTYSTP